MSEFVCLFFERVPGPACDGGGGVPRTSPFVTNVKVTGGLMLPLRQVYVEFGWKFAARASVTISPASCRRGC